MGLRRPFKLLKSCAMKCLCQAMTGGPVFVTQWTHTCTQSDMVHVGGDMKCVCVCLLAPVSGGSHHSKRLVGRSASPSCSRAVQLLWCFSTLMLFFSMRYRHTAELEPEGACLMPKAWDLSRLAHEGYLARSGSHPLSPSQFCWCKWGLLVILQEEVVVFKKWKINPNNPARMENQKFEITAALLPKLGFPLMSRY